MISAVFFLLITLSFCDSNAELGGKDPDCQRNSIEMIIAHGYNAENHTIITEDGYILTTFRIPGKKGEGYKHGRPILLAHGILGSSDNMLDNGKMALPYMLADEGFDVWIMNNRGNRYSRNHTTLDPDKSEKFWEYSFEEMGIYDLKSNMEHIMKLTNYTKVSFLGFSQSGAAVLAAIALQPEYFNKHLRSIALWAPVSNMHHSNTLLKFAYYSYSMYALEFFGVRELFPYDQRLCSFTSIFCKLNPAVCGLLLSFITDRQPYYDNQERWEVIMAHYPVGTSVKSVLHILDLKIYGAFVKHRKTVFHKVDYYNLTNVDGSVPVAIMAGYNDEMVSLEDARWLYRVLNQTKAVKFYKEYDFMGHITFVVPAPKVQTFLFDTLTFFKEHQ